MTGVFFESLVLQRLSVLLNCKVFFDHLLPLYVCVCVCQLKRMFKKDSGKKMENADAQGAKQH